MRGASSAAALVPRNVRREIIIGRHLMRIVCRWQKPCLLIGNTIELVHANHNTGRFDDGVGGLAFFELQLVYRVIGNRCGQGLSANIDTHMGAGGTFLDLNNFSLELVACAEFHLMPPSCCLSTRRESVAG